jgi:hypothetical protein
VTLSQATAFHTLNLPAQRNLNCATPIHKYSRRHQAIYLPQSFLLEGYSDKVFCMNTQAIERPDHS